MAAPAAAAAAPAAKKALIRHGLKALARRRRNKDPDRKGCSGCALIALVVIVAVLCSPLLMLACVAAMAGGGTGLTGADEEIAGIPARAAVAYQRSGGQCPGLDWTLLAAIGAVESDHGRTGGAALDPDTGEAQPWIFGPPLDGQNNTAAIPIGTWVGWWGLTGPWTHAAGPMQFLPATFEAYATDGNGDGTTNPHAIDDAVATTATYLCAASGGPIDGPATVARIYNPGSATYADQLAAAQEDILAALSASSPNAAGSGFGGPIGAATVCPVNGPVEFTDTWGAPRSGGRTHQGVDIFAPTGTPLLAVETGRVEHYNNNLGGLSYRLYGDSGTYYYGTHLSAYENVGAGRVTAGTVIGYVGQTGNAATTPPHLHWEIHPQGRGNPVNPTPTATALCLR